MRKIDESKLNEWQKVQYNFFTKILQVIAGMRMNNGTLARKVGISRCYFSEMKNLDKQMKIDHMLAICNTLNLKFEIIVNDK